MILAVGASVTGWPTIDDVRLGVYAILAGFSLIGLRVDESWEELNESQIGKVTKTLLVPSEPPDGESR